MFRGKTILLTGGTGSFGRAFIDEIVKNHKVKALRIYSRDELKQSILKSEYEKYSHILRFFIGDVRDYQRLKRASEGADIIVHAAALKQVPSSEYNPFEAIKTNILGSQNVIDAAIDNSVEKTVFISSDKAVNPVNLYGATKLCAEKIFVQGNSYAGSRNIRFAVVRYGNVMASRGSVISIFKEQAKNGVLTITDKEMTRFWIKIGDGVKFVIMATELMNGGEIFVPKIPSMKITDLANAIAPKAKLNVVGIRPGEKVHETLITTYEARRAKEFKDYYVIEPEFEWWDTKHQKGGRSLPQNFVYSSDKNTSWLTQKKLLSMLD